MPLWSAAASTEAGRLGDSSSAVIERCSPRFRPVTTCAFAGLEICNSNAIPKAWAVRSVAVVSAGAGPSETTSRRLSGRGSLTTKWSWMTTPLGDEHEPAARQPEQRVRGQRRERQTDSTRDGA